MIRVLVLAGALAASSPVLARQAAVPPAQAPAAEAPAPGEAAFEATAEAFGLRMQRMAEEMQAAITAAAGDAARQDADLDAIEVRYQPEIDAFASALQTFVNAQAAAAPESERAGMTAGIAAALPQIRAIPQQIRAQVEQAAAQPAATPPAP